MKKTDVCWTIGASRCEAVKFFPRLSRQAERAARSAALSQFQVATAGFLISYVSMIATCGGSAMGTRASWQQRSRKLDCLGCFHCCGSEVALPGLEVFEQHAKSSGFGPRIRPPHAHCAKNPRPVQARLLANDSFQLVASSLVFAVQ